MIDFKLNINITQLIIIVIVVIAIFGGGWKLFQNRVDKLENKLESEVKIKNALLDTITTYKNKQGELVSEKLTLQADLKYLKDMNGQLSASQRELLKRIESIEKTNTVIAAALIETNVKLDNIGAIVGESDDSSLLFKKKTDDIDFIIRANYSKALNPIIKPTLVFEKFELYNKSLVEFHWKDDSKKEGYPIAFSVSNSNQYFKTANISSYAIPGLDKEIIDPTGWEKFVSWSKKSKNFIITVGVAGGAGALIGVLFLK